MGYIETGVWGHSSDHGNQTFFMTTYRNKREANALRSYMHKEGIFFKWFTGMEKGVGKGVWHSDVSFLINRASMQQMAADLVLPQHVLLLGACDARDRRPAHAYDRNTAKGVPVGSFRSVDKASIINNEHTSYCMDSAGQCFILEAADAKGRLHT